MATEDCILKRAIASEFPCARRVISSLISPAFSGAFSAFFSPIFGRSLLPFTPLSICSNLCARLTWVKLFVIVAAVSLCGLPISPGECVCLCVCVRVSGQSCQLFGLHFSRLPRSFLSCLTHYYTIYIYFFFRCGFCGVCNRPRP